jgi:hypothetical protein
VSGAENVGFVLAVDAVNEYLDHLHESAYRAEDIVRLVLNEYRQADVAERMQALGMVPFHPNPVLPFVVWREPAENDEGPRHVGGGESTFRES